MLAHLGPNLQLPCIYERYVSQPRVLVLNREQSIDERGMNREDRRVEASQGRERDCSLFGGGEEANAPWQSTCRRCRTRRRDRG